jgi:ankyrin repeat protein
VEKGANIEAKTQFDSNKLPLTADNCSVEIFRFLVENGVGHLSTTSEGCTPLHLAALNNHLESVKYLLQEEAKLLRNLILD